MLRVIKRHLYNIILLSISILLFSLSFPGFFNNEGIPFLSFVALAPMFWVIYKLNYIESVLYGFFFGLCKYLLFNFWFQDFDPAAFAVAPGIHGFYFLLLFPTILFLYKRFPIYGYLPILISWFCYEVFKSTNVVGFSYGVLSQTMYKTHIFTGVADIIGSYALSMLIIFPSIFFTFIFSKKITILKLKTFVPFFSYLVIMLCSIIYTQSKKVDYSNVPTLRVSLIQHNLNCWLSTTNPDLYIQAYDHLEALSREAELLNSDLIVWPETAFVPSIEWHKKYRPSNERERLDLILRMENYLKTTKSLYIIGNNESYNINRDENYNTAYLFNKENIVSKYRKINLVPFTEEFPYPEKFPWLYNYVQELGATQIKPGKSQTLFDIKGIKATILICYEDAFPDLPRQGVNNGSDLLINITNDAWTSFPATPLQHLAAATLRTIETRRTLVRAGTSGFSGVIDPNGQILDSLPLFTKDQLTYDVPVYSGEITIYTKYGKIADNSSYILFILIMAWAFIKFILRRNKID